MADQIASDPALAIPAARPETHALPELHLASSEDAEEEQDRGDRLREILARGDVRDLAAERRDRAAEDRFPTPGDRQGWLDRDWAGRDRDAAAVDRADLLALLAEPTGDADEPGD
jgi:hypothetical protein